MPIKHIQRNINKQDNKINLTEEELEIFKKCSTNIIEFTKYIKILNPDPKKGWLNFHDVMFPKQRQILQSFQKNWSNKYIVLLSPRQSSKTTLVLIFILWLITFTSGSNVGILANKKENARKIFRRFVGMYRQLPDFFKLAKSIGDNKTELELDDGTIVFCSATSRSGLRSESLTFLYLDEFAHLLTRELQQEFWTANYPVLQAMDGGLIVSSTPKGKDLFYELYLKTQKEIDGKPNPLYHPKWILEEIHWKDVDPRGIGRDEKWKEQTIRDLNAEGKNGAEVFAQEFENSFEVQAGLVKFFNQQAINRFKIKNPEYEWIPDKNYEGESFKIYDRIKDQHFLVGVDVAEGKFLNFSTVVGLSLYKKKIENLSVDVDNFYLQQAFQFMHAGILPDTFFDLLFNFLITHLNDQWFLVFELNDVGRIFSIRFDNLLLEITTNDFSQKNAFFKRILREKFEGNNNEMVYYLQSRVYRSFGGAKKRSYIPWGIKSDRKNVLEMKTNMKRFIDIGNINLYDQFLIEEIKYYEDKRGRETIEHPYYQGVSHFDLISALKFALWMMSDRDRIRQVLNIKPLKQNKISKEQMILESIIKINNIKYREEYELQVEIENNLNELEPHGNVPLTYIDNKYIIQNFGNLTEIRENLNNSFVWVRNYSKKK